MNPGLVTSIWGLTPFLNALTDRIFFNSRIKPHHVLGMALACTCYIILAIKDEIEPHIEGFHDHLPEEPHHIPEWIPLALGFSCLIGFNISNMSGKYMA